MDYVQQVDDLNNVSNEYYYTYLGNPLVNNEIQAVPHTILDCGQLLAIIMQNDLYFVSKVGNDCNKQETNKQTNIQSKDSNIEVIYNESLSRIKNVQFTKNKQFIVIQSHNYTTIYYISNASQVFKILQLNQQHKKFYLNDFTTNHPLQNKISIQFAIYYKVQNEIKVYQLSITRQTYKKGNIMKTTVKDIQSQVLMHITQQSMNKEINITNIYQIDFQVLSNSIILNKHHTVKINQQKLEYKQIDEKILLSKNYIINNKEDWIKNYGKDVYFNAKSQELFITNYKVVIQLYFKEDYNTHPQNVIIYRNQLKNVKLLNIQNQIFEVQLIDVLYVIYSIEGSLYFIIFDPLTGIILQKQTLMFQNDLNIKVQYIQQLEDHLIIFTNQKMLVYNLSNIQQSKNNLNHIENSQQFNTITQTLKQHQQICDLKLMRSLQITNKKNEEENILEWFEFDEDNDQDVQQQGDQQLRKIVVKMQSQSQQKSQQNQ